MPQKKSSKKPPTEERDPTLAGTGPCDECGEVHDSETLEGQE